MIDLTKTINAQRALTQISIANPLHNTTQLFTELIRQFNHQLTSRGLMSQAFLITHQSAFNQAGIFDIRHSSEYDELVTMTTGSEGYIHLRTLLQHRIAPLIAFGIYDSRPTEIEIYDFRQLDPIEDQIKVASIQVLEDMLDVE